MKIMKHLVEIVDINNNINNKISWKIFIFML